MASGTGTTTAEVALLSAERRIRTALRALLQADRAYTVSVAGTPAEARALLAAARPAAVVVGLGSSHDLVDKALLAVAEQEHPRPVVIVGHRGGLDLDASPDAILDAVGRAVGGSPTQEPA